MIIETRKRKGYTIEIHVDEDCESPRNNDGNFLFLTFPSRDCIKADEEIDPDRMDECPSCHGSGYLLDTEGESIDCITCSGDGEVYAETMAQWVASLKAAYNAHLVLPVSRDEHGPNCRYYVNDWADEIDGTICGFILDTPETLEERGFPTPITEAWLREGMEAEIDEYSKWANGECYGYVIKDRNGDEVEDGSLWGMIGSEYVDQEADAFVDDLPEQPPVLYDVRLTKAEIDSIVDRLGHWHPAHRLSVIDKLEAIDTEEEEA